MPLSPRDAYQLALQQGFVEDPAQGLAVEHLHACHEALHVSSRNRVRGIYLWGPVGRGKTWLMDRFHEGLSVPVRRQHFHHFMRWVHKRLFELTGQSDPLSTLAKELATELRVLCLDELFINDIGDAMILGPLFRQLFDSGLVLVLTSNQPPQDLYSHGHHRDRLLPAIDAIQKHMDIVDVRGPEDHRLHPGAQTQRYWIRDTARPEQMAELFARLAGERGHTQPLTIGERRIEVLSQNAHVLWCSYDQLCEAPLWANDYIELCDRFDHILLSDLPPLASEQQLSGIARGTEDAAERVDTGDREMPPLSRRDNGVRRFIALVDECYDRGVPLYLEAAVAMDSLYPQGYLEFAFRRTLSRLKEMQLSRFGLQPAG
ncbi:cell division protein ZapE [Marinobacterium zhoushanense]|uniref:Cell division protein ZapE n=1 Tax=Marinobacterium zhoushanense TaxID=1679163 RepID=A0ABQ1KP71_9GAMM|nr:cell division protein ZapE [Marinobacterium zhoushanense]GGC01996.1 cell division protein ZapE [Marinobacterium zhoushanense]